MLVAIKLCGYWMTRQLISPLLTSINFHFPHNFGYGHFMRLFKKHRIYAQTF